MAADPPDAITLPHLPEEIWRYHLLPLMAPKDRFATARVCSFICRAVEAIEGDWRRKYIAQHHDFDEDAALVRRHGGWQSLLASPHREIEAVTLNGSRGRFCFPPNVYSWDKFARRLRSVMAREPSFVNGFPSQEVPPLRDWRFITGGRGLFEERYDELLVKPPYNAVVVVHCVFRLRGA